MNNGRDQHTSTVLTDGKVLVVGGDRDGKSELYDPLTGIWTLADSMNYLRFLHTASVLKNGKVLVSGGGTDTSMSIDDTELYDPSTRNWTVIDKMHVRRCSHAACILQNGNVIVSGGTTDYDPTNTVELFNSSTGTFINAVNNDNRKSPYNRPWALTNEKVPTIRKILW